MWIYAELGDRIERACGGRPPDRRTFPRIAADVLREVNVPGRSGPEDLLAWLFDASALPHQEDLAEAFGEPPLTVYRGAGFHIEVLFWMSTVTTVHTHGFSGAFQALSGDRLQTRHSFDPDGPARGPIRFGRVRFEGAEILRPGDIVEITNDLAHAIVHLEAPSATIVVRTPSDPAITAQDGGSNIRAEQGPQRIPTAEEASVIQLDYRAPHIAWDPFARDDLRARKLGALRLLLRLRRPDALDRAARVIRGSDVATCLGVLDLAYRTFGTKDRIASVIEVARATHGAEPIAAMLEVLREERRLRAVQALRAGTTDADERFFLALLHHVPTWEDIAPLLTARFPGPALRTPEAVAVERAAALSGVDRIGIDFDDALSEPLFRAMLGGPSPAVIRKRLASTFDAAEVRANAAEIDRHAERMRGTMLAPLFRKRSRDA